MEKTRWGIVAVAVAAAILVGFVAPGSWPAGEPEIVVDYEGPGQVGFTTEPGNPVRVYVQVVHNADLIRPELDDLKVSARLPDGTEELVPVLTWDKKRQALVAARRAPTDAALALGLLAFVVVLWVSEAVPLFVTSLLVPIVLVVAGAQGAKAALAPFFHPIIALFFGGFLMAEAMRRTKLDHRVALGIVARAGKSPATLFAALLGVSAFMSMWMSNTAATALLVPIAIAVTEPLGHPGYKRAAVLGIAYAATLGGTGSAIGTPANPIAIEFLSSYVGRDISFTGWFLYGLPLVVLFLPILGVYLWRRSGVELDRAEFDRARQAAREELARLGPLTREQLVTLAVFLVVVGLWLTQLLHGISTGIVALIGAVGLALLGKVKSEDLGRISWAALLTFGGGLALGAFLVESGTSDWIATRFSGLSGLPTVLAVGATAVLALALTAVASNTATAAMLVPLSIPLAGILGVDATMLVVVVALASSIDFALVIGTPPTMIAYSTKLFTARHIFRTGIVLDIVGIIVLVTAVVGIWQLMGLV